MNASSCIFDRDRLISARLSVALNAPEARKQILRLTMDKMAAIEFSCHLHGQTQAAPCLFEVFGVGRHPDEISTQSNECRDLTVNNGAAGVSCVIPSIPRRRKSILLGELIQRH